MGRDSPVPMQSASMTKDSVRPIPCLAFLLVATIASPSLEAADPYQDVIAPYLKKYCIECHITPKPKGDLDFSRYTKPADVVASYRRWNNIIEFIRAGEMPPEDANQPTIDESNAAVAAVESILIEDARKNAGDPGIVLPRRLSNTEYDLSVRELTGIDLRPTKDFPADPAGGEGFDNTGEVLRMSPNLVKKYLSAAEHVANHLVLKPDGISFAPFPVTSYNERKKLTEQAIIDFYEQHAVDTKQYLEAAWRYRFRKEEQRDLTIQQWAESRGLSKLYLSLVWDTFQRSSSGDGYLKELDAAWNAVPAPANETNQPAELNTLFETVEFGRRMLTPPVQPLIRSNAGNWPISHLDFRAKIAAARDKFDRSSLKSESLITVFKVDFVQRRDREPAPYSVYIHINPGFAEGEQYVLFKQPIFSKDIRLPRNDEERKIQQVESLRSVLQDSDPKLVTQLGFGHHPLGEEIDPDSFAVEAPAVIEIPITVEMQRQLKGEHLLVTCQLDPKHSREGSAFVQTSVREPAQTKFGKRVEHLIFSESKTAEKLIESSEVFCRAFPNRFCYVDRGRGLAAGFHLVEGFFRDDRPLVEKVLTEEENAELDRLWRELDFVTQSAETLLRGFVWFERSEREVLHDKRFDFLRSEDPQLVEEQMLTKFEKIYLDKMGIKRVGETLEPESPSDKYNMIHGFFTQIRQGLQRQKDLTVQAEYRAFRDLEQLARRAYRRELRQQERESLRSLYLKLRDDGQTVEASLRGVLTAVLMSPEFCYRYRDVPDGEGIQPLSDHDLASRLSFFLWSSLPDEVLLSQASKHELQHEDELLKQTRRMLKDQRISAFSREFFGQWLRYRDYLSKDPINADAFPGYDDELRQAIFEEPVRLATHLIQTDQPIIELLQSDVTFVNRRLAKHYGGDLERQYIRAVASDPTREWHQVSGLKQAGRGGLFGMAVVLTTNSAGERTSPVKRGFWAVHHLLGQHFPPPPADVPELPASEKGATKTIRELLATHVEEAQCAMCHKHFDSLGLALEGFDPIGRARTTDAAGRPIDHVATLPSGEVATGIPGLIEYIDRHRREDFVRTLCRKFLGYALGRSVQLSDQSLLAEMEQSLSENEYRFSVLFEVVVKSPQFRRQRSKNFLTTNRSPE